MRPREYAVLGTLALIWGASFLFIRVAVREISPFDLVFFRLGIGSLVLLPAIIIRPRLIAGWHRYIPGLVLVGLCNTAIPYTLFGYGEQHIPSGHASIINATTPLFAVILTTVLPGAIHERLTATRGVGVLISFGGVLVLVGPSIFAAGGTLLAYGACLLAALLYAVSNVIARLTLQGAPLLAQAFFIDFAGFLFVMPVALVTGLPTRLPSTGALVSIGILSTLGTAVAFLLLYWLIQHVGVVRASLVTYLLPCTALIWGAVLLHEMITPNVLAGLALVLLGIAIVNRVFRRRPAPVLEVATPIVAPE
jgi:drug/metabolite transporter (DMT)-like permease